MTVYAITTAALTRHFDDVTAVDGVNLKVPQGSVYGFLGPNGAGKTTTIRMLLGLISPHAGEVQLFDMPLRKHRVALLRRVGALVEGPSLYPHLTGRENLEVTRRLVSATRAQRERVLNMVCMEEVASRLVKTYSMGMRQRLALALALLSGPELLILDEPTNGLDPAGIHEIRELICRLPQEYNVTVFISSHMLSEIEQVATHIGIIQKGQLSFQGTLEDLHAQMEDHVVLEVDHPKQAKTLLSQAGWHISSNGSQRVTVAVNGKSDAAMINKVLVTGGVNVHHLNLTRPTLEDIFLQLTQEVQE